MMKAGIPARSALLRTAVLIVLIVAPFIFAGKPSLYRATTSSYGDGLWAAGDVAKISSWALTRRWSRSDTLPFFRIRRLYVRSADQIRPRCRSPIAIHPRLLGTSVLTLVIGVICVRLKEIEASPSSRWRSRCSSTQSS